MPSKSKSQAKFFAAAAHNPEFAKKAGISQSAAKEWNAADEKEGNLKKGSKLPDKVKESSMRSLVDIVQDAELADTDDRTCDIMDSCDDEKDKLDEMPQRFDSFQGQDRDEFVDKTAEMTGKKNMVKFAEHKEYDVYMNKHGTGFIAYDKAGKQLAIVSGHLSNDAVLGVPNVFQIAATASKTGTKGIIYNIFMDMVANGVKVLSDSLHTDDAIKFWTRLIGSHQVYIVGGGEVLAKASLDKVHKYWSDDESSPSAELKLMLVK
ncbi:hypothetical protein QPL51_03585 [Escherichia coli]|uniref:hypothetical protein n=1 Tax=Escherichia coli TaxID=562 RepID=UPI0011647586|nr:hypothetical protein [Escherichia coli]MED6536558.1 hypothetical protein [Escherichia coli O157]QDF13790.1 hypothetical protein vBEcoMphAPEC6_gp161c [Escherichia phage vB_EcoM_phAPEC6]MDS1552119.1 hypothetical protein [Escherichia coli]MED6561955.1 hypothetical protein [Escherichia coli O157]MED6970954.1 hypothetical protein [Escherichia coli O157]